MTTHDDYLIAGTLRRVRVVTVKRSKHRRDKCMACSKKPVVACHWADGRGMAWFCLRHFKAWVKEDEREVVGVWFLENGESPENIRKNPPGTVKIRKLGESLSQKEIFSRLEKLIERRKDSVDEKLGQLGYRRFTIQLIENEWHIIDHRMSDRGIHKPGTFRFFDTEIEARERCQRLNSDWINNTRNRDEFLPHLISRKMYASQGQRYGRYKKLGDAYKEALGLGWKPDKDNEGVFVGYVTVETDDGAVTYEQRLMAQELNGEWFLRVIDESDLIKRGGPGSGHHGHRGRVGEIGGSEPGRGVAGPAREPLRTPGAHITTGFANIREGFLISTPEGASAKGYLFNADFPNQRSKPTRGELFYIEVPERLRRRGIGTSLALDALRQMLANGATTVNMDVTTNEGLALIESLIRNGYIEGPIQESDTKAEYNITNLIERGGPGSGHHGHKGRLGETGGSEPGKGAPHYRPGAGAPRGYGGPQAGGGRAPAAATAQTTLADVDPGDSATVAQHSNASAEQVEPELTGMMERLAKVSEGRLEETEYAVKSVESLQDKIERDMREKGISAQEAASDVNDRNRYTIVLSNEEFVAKVAQVQAELENQGWTQYDQKYKNFFGGGDTYDGYNTVVVHASGQRFELQFHTEESIAIKSQVHPLYKRFHESTDQAERLTIYNQMADAYVGAVRPEGFDQLQGRLVYQEEPQ